MRIDDPGIHQTLVGVHKQFAEYILHRFEATLLPIGRSQCVKHGGILFDHDLDTRLGRLVHESDAVEDQKGQQDNLNQRAGEQESESDR